MSCRVVGGMDVLVAMERVGTDEEDRPREEVRIATTTVFTNPFQEAEEEVCHLTLSLSLSLSCVHTHACPHSCWQRKRRRRQSQLGLNLALAVVAVVR